MTPDWELMFPFVSLQPITRIGSDHVPLIMSSMDERPRPPSRFRFEAFWLKKQGFTEAVRARWLAPLSEPHRAMSAVNS